MSHARAVPAPGVERVAWEVLGGRVEALAAGPANGELVLLLHGFPDVPRTFLSLLRRLAGRGHRAVAPWLRGYLPTRLPGESTPLRLAADVCALADALAPSRPVRLVGHDWGALAAWGALVLRPERFSRAVTLAVPHPAAVLRNVARAPRQLRRSWYMGFFQVPGLPEARLGDASGRLLRRLWRDWSPGWDAPEEHLTEVIATVAASLPGPLEPYRALPSFARAVGREARWRAPLAVPVLHLHGRTDGCVLPELCAGQERHAPAGRTLLVEGAGHFLHLERPEPVEAELTGWLEGSS